MQPRRLSSFAERRFLLVFEEEDELVAELARFARDQRLSGAEFTGLGRLADVVLEPGPEHPLCAERSDGLTVESLDGRVRVVDGEPRIAVFVLVRGPEGEQRGGRLLSAHVRPALKLVLTETGPDAAAGAQAWS